MIVESRIKKSPISDMDWSFGTYLNRRMSQNARHISGDDITDYAYGLDYELHKKLDAIPGLHSFATKFCVTQITRELQRLNRDAVAVTPTQFPDIYDIACDCADRLGMAVPNIYVVNNPTLNAAAYCADDIQPVIEINSGSYERLTPGELKAMIGHECGHVQNNHVIYSFLSSQIASIGTNALIAQFAFLSGILTYGTLAALATWSLASEVTADRAGMICSDDVEDAYRMNAKLMYGATFKEQEIDFKSLEEQLKQQMGNISKYDEMLESMTYIAKGYGAHPSGIRRIMAEKEFGECEVLYSWRPDLQKPNSILRSREECEARTRAYVDIFASKEAR